MDELDGSDGNKVGKRGQSLMYHLHFIAFKNAGHLFRNWSF